MLYPSFKGCWENKFLTTTLEKQDSKRRKIPKHKRGIQKLSGSLKQDKCTPDLALGFFPPHPSPPRTSLRARAHSLLRDHLSVLGNNNGLGGHISAQLSMGDDLK